MAQQAAANGFEVLEEDRLYYDSGKAIYRYVVRSSRDIRHPRSDTHASTHAPHRDVVETGSQAR